MVALRSGVLLLLLLTDELVVTRPRDPADRVYLLDTPEALVRLTVVLAGDPHSPTRNEEVVLPSRLWVLSDR